MNPSGETVSDRAGPIELTIERPAVGGRMIARWEGRVVLVAGAIPGEQVRAVVEGRRGGAILARTLDVTSPSPDRRPVAVPASCGGRALAHVAYPRQLAIKAEIVRDAFRRIGRIDLAEPPVMAGSPETGYRMRARLHAGENGVGFLDEGSHRVCGAAGTGVLSAGAERVAAALDERAPELLAGGVRTIELTEDLAGQRCVLHLLAHGSVADAGIRWEALAGTRACRACRWRRGRVRGRHWRWGRPSSPTRWRTSCRRPAPRPSRCAGTPMRSFRRIVTSWPG